MPDEPERGGDAPSFGDPVIAGHPVDPVLARDVSRFRRAERARLYAQRRGLPAAELRRMETVVASVLGAILDLSP
jgi:hypothetical protein